MSEMQSSRSGEPPLRVLWISEGCSLQDQEGEPGLSGRMESVVARYRGNRIRLGVAYMADGTHESRLTRNGIDYYAVAADLRVGIREQEWEKARAELLRVIREFRPDIIQCFGAEWPYGAIAESVDIPVVIHMMGFLNIYFLSIHTARGESGGPARNGNRIRAAAGRLFRRGMPEESAEDRCERTELRVMRSVRFFFGRTEWDRNVVRYYSPGSRYFHMPEMLKPAFYEAAGQWKYHSGDKIRIFSMSSADDRKGNEIILRAADLLKNLAGLEFEWRIAGHEEYFPFYEQRAGIRHGDVNVTLLGMLGSREIIEELESADFFVHPSIMDNSPHTVCEAQLVGCPVIASCVGGVPDLVRNRETGFLYPYNEPHTLAFMIANLRGEKELLSGISENAVRAAQARHDPGKIAELLARAYQTIMEESGHG